MILIDHTCVSEDIADCHFVCELTKCKGACCVEGDLGAPLEANELPILKEVYEFVEPYLSEKGKKAIAEQGFYIEDWEGDFSTPTINDKECAYSIYDKQGILKCGIEQAYLDGKIAFKKPISCHLYPIRVLKMNDGTQEIHALNYDRWDICSPACHHGQELGIPIYRFLKEPLIRSYGEVWYNELVREIESR